MIEFINVSKRYANNWLALDEVNFEIEKGEFLFVTGPTGAGKTTILRLIYREEIPTEGLVKVRGINIANLNVHTLPDYRKNIGIVFQDFKLLTDRTVYENLEFGLKVIGTESDRIREKIVKILTRLGMLHKKDAYPFQLSGGEQQKVAIARALNKDPEIILADEPTGNIDTKAAEEIMNIFKEINLSGTTVVIATHQTELPKSLKKRFLQIVSGRIHYDGF